MSETEEYLTFEVFKAKILNFRPTIPYRQVIIKSLLNRFPNSRSQLKLENDLRSFFNTTDSYKKLGFWTDLIDFKILRVTNFGYELNLRQISKAQITELNYILQEQIDNCKKTSKDDGIVNSTQQQTYEQRNSPESSNNTDQDFQYYLYKIVSGEHKNLSETKISDIKSKVVKQDFRNFELGKNTQKHVILYDTVKKNIRIWGKSVLKTNPKSRLNIQLDEFTHIQYSGEPVRYALLKSKFVKEYMFHEKKLRRISRDIYINILDNLIESAPLDKINEYVKPFEQESENDARKISTIGSTGSAESDQVLEMPSPKIIQEGIEKIRDEILVAKEKILEILIHLVSGRHVLLAGPVGTGKTHLARCIPKMFWPNSTNNIGYDTKVYTATNDWSSDDIISGIIPRTESGNAVYKIQDGCVVETIKISWKSKKTPNKTQGGTWPIIDEINRTDIDKVFGQLFTALETKEILTPVENSVKPEILRIPRDYRIIGTMNTTDKHYLFKMSDALKRRFAYVEIPSPTKEEKELEVYSVLKNSTKELGADSFSGLIKLDHTKRKISTGSEQAFVEIIYSAYDILSFIRRIKDLGPAVLKSIFQTLLVGKKVEKNLSKLLDIGLNANIVPQLERISPSNLDLIIQFSTNDPYILFKEKHEEENDVRLQYSGAFKTYLEYLDYQETDKILNNFTNKNIAKETWVDIFQKWEKLKPSTLPKKLPSFTKSLKDLKIDYDLI